MDPHAIDRDHFRLRRVRDLAPGETLPLNEQFQCGMCGQVFFMAASLERHKQDELPAFIAWATEARAAWERRHGRVILVPKEQCE